jgi:hypothetical protein
LFEIDLVGFLHKPPSLTAPKIKHPPDRNR